MLGTIQNIPAQAAQRETEVSPLRSPASGYDKENQDTLSDFSERDHSESTVSEEQNTTALSTLSLIRFLENILEQKLGIHGDPTSPKWFSNLAVNQNQAKRAAYAYAHAAEISKAKLSHLSRTRTHKNTRTVNTEEIYALIRNLREIYASGILSLNVAQDLSFFESVKLAVADIKLP